MAGLSKIAPVYRHGFILASSMAISYWWTLRWLKARSKKLLAKDVNSAIGARLLKKEKVAVDRKFLRNILVLLKILVPKLLSGETFYLVLIACALIARTYADVWMIQNSTAVESAIIGRSSKLFKANLSKFVYAMPMISLVNNALKYGLDELKLRFRCRLTKYLYDQYLKGFTYYQLNNLDSRIANVDQLLTQDVEKFSTCIADLYTNVSKPFLDIIIFSKKLTTSIGPTGPSLRRPVGSMTVTEQQFEGEFRYVNSRLITNCEEIAFYKGNRREQMNIRDSFDRLIKHLRSFIIFRVSMGFIDNIVAKYVSTCVGYYVVSRPFLNLADNKYANASQSDILEDYYTSGRMLVKMAEAVGRLVLAGREMTKLAGYTTRVIELMTVLRDINQGKYVRTMISNATINNNNNNNQNSIQPKPDMGKIQLQDRIIKFENVPLITPNGDILIESLNFTVRSGQNVIVCGPNGCGKSSLFRTVGELWPVYGGVLTKPSAGQLFYIPQKPYMTIGTLRDQIIYPDSRDDMRRRGLTDKDLLKLLEEVQLTYILQREGGFDATQDWMDVLSGGEKQRIAMARVFYSKPQFAILDECTSAVSVDVEANMYEYCKTVGITLFTVSHRKSLWKHHEYCLYMDGRGKYEFKRIDENTLEFGS
ncbi:unnamed protein product [Didymodactylos carnosus]|uniref:ABC transporter domain-containing protein n=3 Tax=Didymodactylos carnosus TaxID=1234261 RepID=A0A813WIB9_9BILA|nr:unnamed protein product [Didymodactylos carnosus]CAF3645964.1 unnamed protein product [Didymodactylos carnosus]